MRSTDPVAVTGTSPLHRRVNYRCDCAVIYAAAPLSDVTAAGYASLAYAALIGALGGQFMSFYVTRRFGATAFSLNAYLIPVVATTFGVLILGEIVTWGMFVGMLLIGGGIYLINRPAARLSSRRRRV